MKSRETPSWKKVLRISTDFHSTFDKVLIYITDFQSTFVKFDNKSYLVPISVAPNFLSLTEV